MATYSAHKNQNDKLFKIKYTIQKVILMEQLCANNQAKHTKKSHKVDGK